MERIPYIRTDDAGKRVDVEISIRSNRVMMIRRKLMSQTGKSLCLTTYRGEIDFPKKLKKEIDYLAEMEQMYQKFENYTGSDTMEIWYIRLDDVGLGVKVVLTKQNGQNVRIKQEHYVDKPDAHNEFCSADGEKFKEAFYKETQYFKQLSWLYSELLNDYKMLSAS